MFIIWGMKYYETPCILRSESFQKQSSTFLAWFPLKSSLNPDVHLCREKILQEIMQKKWKIVFENVLISE